VESSVVFLLTGKGFNSDHFSIAFEAKFPQVTFVENPPMKTETYHKLKHGYLIYSWSDIAFKGAIMNRIW